MSAWDNLPNARHIDRVITSLKKHPEIWDAAHDEAYDETHDEAWETAWDAIRVEPWDSTLGAAFDAAWGAIWEARSLPEQAARDAIMALMAYDDSAKYLTMPSEQLKTWAFLSEDPAAILLLPAVIAYEKISELETT